MMLLAVFTVYVALDTFVIARVYGDTSIQKESVVSTVTAGSSDDADEDDNLIPVITSDSYTDGNMTVEVKRYTVEDTEVYLAEASLDSSEYLQTAFAHEAYGKNVTQTTSEIAESAGAILAINGDFYGARESGYVIRNGYLYRSDAASGQEDLVIYSDGSFGIINESDVSAEQLIADGAVQTLSFGPALVQNGEVVVGANDEVGKAMASNPRTAIGIKTDGTYMFVVSDGRTDESEGLSLEELAEFMKSMGAVTAYNLDGGGSSTMVFNGNVINNPTGGHAGHGEGSERSVSDIVYIGY
jgi:exopolysaccharide biosynthesis protein